MRIHLSNIILQDKGESLEYKPMTGGAGRTNYPFRDSRKEHGERLKSQFELAWKKSKEACEDRLAVSASVREGVYLQIKGKAGYDLITKSLEDTRQGVRLVNIQINDDEEICATVYIPNAKHDFFIKKINQYCTNDKGNEVVGTIESIQIALIEAMWIGDKSYIPKDEPIWIETWLRYDKKKKAHTVKAEFMELCNHMQITVKSQHIIFPERVVVGIQADHRQLSALLERCSYLAEFRKMVSPTSFFMQLPAHEQREWSVELAKRIVAEDSDEVSVCLLDTGVNNGHPILEKVLKDRNLHTIELSRGVEDRAGHGTNMAGIAAFCTLEDKLESMDTIPVYHFLESVKMLDRPTDNPEELYGELTSEAISLAEIENPDTKRVICMAITAKTDTTLDGRPSSWSGAVDSIISGVGEEGNLDHHRLMFISAGNTTLEEIQESADYKTAIINHSVENPGQAWNAVTVGAYTQLDQIDGLDYRGYHALADAGELSPYTSTSLSWDYKKWPIKPEIVLEGGNVAYSEKDHFFTEADDLSLLTTGHKYLQGHPFDVIRMTSSATAQASWIAAQIWKKYPELWPETVRALMIHSAEWTPQMINDMEKNGKLAKADYRKLLRTCGYGVPNLSRALWSASNSVNLLIQDELQPYLKKNGSVLQNEMHVHTLPWPKKLLLEYEETTVRMKVTLSYYIEPGPGEIGWKDKYRYPSCGLLFDVNNPMEDRINFMKRISKAVWEDENDRAKVKNDSERWLLGANNRNVGSIHSDTWEGTASQLAESNMIVIYPKAGWWKSRAYLNKYHSKVRYSLVVTLEMPEVNVDLYTPIMTEIKRKDIVKTEIEALKKKPKSKDHTNE